MSGSAQRLANYFPLWTRLRVDPSSVGHRLFQALGGVLDEMGVESTQLSRDWHLTKNALGVGELWVVDLSEEDIPATSQSAGFAVNSEEFTLVEGAVGADTFVVSRDEYLEDLVNGVPTRVSEVEVVPLTSIEVWDSSDPTTYNEIQLPGRLRLWVRNSTHYKVRTTLQNREASNQWIVRIKGWDLNGIRCDEVVQILDDGVWETLHLYSEVDEVLLDGFDGDVTIYCGAVGLVETDPFRVLVTTEVEGPLRLSFTVSSIYGLNRTELTYQTQNVKAGWQYRTGSEVMDNTELVADVLLRDEAGVDVEAVGVAVSPNNTRLYVVSEDGYLHVYDHTLPGFVPPAEEQTLESYISILPVRSYPVLGGEESLWTWFRQARAKVVDVEIKRVSPSGVTRYLQSDKTWGAAVYRFPGQSGVLPEDTWQDFKFTTEYDEVGQWDYTCSVATILGGDRVVSQVSVLVGALTALVSVDTGVVSPVGVWFDSDGNLVVWDGAEAHILQEHRDTYLFDVDSSRLVFREAYDSIEVTP